MAQFSVGANSLVGPQELAEQLDTGLEDRLTNMRLFAEAARLMLLRILSAGQKAID